MRFTVDEIIAGWLNVTFDMGSDVFAFWQQMCGKRTAPVSS